MKMDLEIYDETPTNVKKYPTVGAFKRSIQQNPKGKEKLLDYLKFLDENIKLHICNLIFNSYPYPDLNNIACLYYMKSFINYELMKTINFPLEFQNIIDQLRKINEQSCLSFINLVIRKIICDQLSILFTDRDLYKETNLVESKLPWWQATKQWRIYEESDNRTKVLETLRPNDCFIELGVFQQYMQIQFKNIIGWIKLTQKPLLAPTRIIEPTYVLDSSFKRIQENKCCKSKYYKKIIQEPIENVIPELLMLTFNEIPIIKFPKSMHKFCQKIIYDLYDTNTLYFWENLKTINSITWSKSPYCSYIRIGDINIMPFLHECSRFHLAQKHLCIINFEGFKRYYSSNKDLYILGKVMNHDYYFHDSIDKYSP